MTRHIVALFMDRRKRPSMDAVTADRLALMRYRVRLAGDWLRELDQWRDSYRIRTGRVA